MDPSELMLDDIQCRELEEPPGISPPPTRWQITARCPCCPPCVILPDSPERLFWGHWEVSLCMPILILILTSYCIIVFMWLVSPPMPLFQKWLSWIGIFILAGFFLWSYYAAVFMDPGFFPFDWIQSQKEKYDWGEQLSGLALRRDQIEFARANRPPFASFSHAAGRFVVRADHICFWISNWVGKRNHKQFILMSFWGGALAMTLFAWNLAAATRAQELHFWPTVMVLIAVGMETVILIGFVFVFVVNLNDLRKNTTRIRAWKEERGDSYSFMRSLREVFGEGSIWMWPIPLPAFGDRLHIGDLPPAPGEVLE